MFRYQNLLLVKDKKLNNFLKFEFYPLVPRNFNDTTISLKELCLNAGDFGTHNIILNKFGYNFIDMEFFGWDSPVKQISDVLWHPAMNLNDKLSRKFLNESFLIYSKNKYFHDNLKSQLNLFGLKWALIVLNPYIREWGKSRNLLYKNEYEILKSERLIKSQNIIKSIISKEKIFAYY
jgi:hypothetical protein